MSVLAYVFGVSAVLIGLFFIWKSEAGSRKIGEITNDWDVVQGELTKVDYVKPDVDSVRAYAFDVEYEYDVDRKTGTTVYPSVLGSQSRHTEEEVESFTSEYSVGDTVEVYMNPEDKSESCLAVVDIESVKQGRGKAKLFGGFFVVVGLLFILVGAGVL